MKKPLTAWALALEARYQSSSESERAQPPVKPRALLGYHIKQMTPPSRQQLLAELQEFAATASSPQVLMQHMCDQLRRLPAYNWVGFYLLDPTGEFLNLGPFNGAPTPHIRIPLDQGICGAAAASGKTVVVDDVHADPRYLSCSIETQSEIVAPVFVNGIVAGELDIDSHTPAAFTPEDQTFVEECAALAGTYFAGFVKL